MAEGLKIDIKPLVENILQIDEFYDYFNNEKYLSIYFVCIDKFNHLFRPVNPNQHIRFYCDDGVIHDYDLTGKTITLSQTEVSKYVCGFYEHRLQDPTE